MKRWRGFAWRILFRAKSCSIFPSIEPPTGLESKEFKLSKLPLPVSRTVAVVRTRVSPRILPPTIIEAPTSEITPNANSSPSRTENPRSAHRAECDSAGAHLRDQLLLDSRAGPAHRLLSSFGRKPLSWLRGFTKRAIEFC